jgi:hypothetical protein
MRVLVRHGVVVVLVLAGVADIASGDPVAHGLALVAVAAALAASEVRRRRGAAASERSRRRFVVTVPGAVGALAYAILVGGFARFSWPISVAVAIPGGSAVAFAWRGTPELPVRTPSEDRAGTLAWALLFVALGLWELQALLLQPSLTTSSWAHPTLSTLMDPVLASHSGRSITLGAWLFVGGWLLER